MAQGVLKAGDGTTTENVSLMKTLFPHGVLDPRAGHGIAGTPKHSELGEEDRENEKQRARQAERKRKREHKKQERKEDVEDVVCILESCLHEGHPFPAAARSRNLDSRGVLLLLDGRENWVEGEKTAFNLTPNEIILVLSELKE